MGSEKARGPQVLTAPSPLRGSVAIKEHEVDTLGAFPPAEPTDFELALINDLLDRYGDALRMFVLMKREARASDSCLNKEKKQATLWPRYECRTHGDGVPFGRAFDSLIRRCELQDSKK